MRPGTPGFVSERLAQARKSRGMSMADVAREIGVTRQMVSQYENGQQTPGPEILARIAQVLSFRQSFFMWPVPESRTDGPMFWRSMASASKTSRERASVSHEWTVDLCKYVAQWIDLPKVEFPSFDVPKDLERISTQAIEDLATKTRRHWSMGDGPIGNMVWLLENKGAVVARLELDADALDGQSQWIDGRPFIQLNADKCSAARSRFDIAHELGHLVLHRGLDSSIIHRSTEHKLIEQQANDFAGAFLLPAQTFASEVHAASLDQFRSLKDRWKASIGLMLMRAIKLDLVTEKRAEYLWISYSRKGWRTCEPLDDELPVERPRLLRQALNAILTNKLQSREDVLANVPLSQGYVEALAGMDRGFFNLEEAEIVSLPTRPVGSAAPTTDVGAGGDVIQFPGRGRPDGRN